MALELSLNEVFGMTELVELGLMPLNECGEHKDGRYEVTSGSMDDTVALQRCLLDY